MGRVCRIGLHGAQEWWQGLAAWPGGMGADGRQVQGGWGVGVPGLGVEGRGRGDLGPDGVAVHRKCSLGTPTITASFGQHSVLQ